MKHPISTFSNLIYLTFAGLMAMGETPNWVLVASMAGLAASSFAFHLSGEKHNTPAHKADEGAIYLVLTALLCHVWANNIWLVLGAFTAVPFLLMRLERVDLFKVGPALAVAVLVSLFITQGFERAGAALLIGLLAGFTRFVVQKKVEMDKPNLIDIVHGVWHAFSASAIYLVWVATT